MIGIMELGFVSLFGIVWLVVVIYLVVLAQRLVRAVEKIAARLGS